MLDAKGIHKSYTMGKTPVRVLRGASLQAEPGEFLVITGASGCGKSTLLHILGALDTPDRGTMVFNGQHVFQSSGKAQRGYRSRSVGFVFQFYHLLPECNVLENVMMPRLVAHTWAQWTFGGAKRQARRDAEEILKRVGLADRRAHRPRELSGGERQRVAIARALVNKPALLLADEPTGNLDATTGGEVMNLLADFNKAGQAIIMVSHDVGIAARAHRRLHLSEGVLREA